MTVARLAGVAGALAAGLAVILGAFGAHALRAGLDADALAVWKTAVDYQFWHALGLVGIALLARDAVPDGRLRTAAIAFVVGIVLFCASLYALALGAPRALGLLTPLGGVAFIVGWLALALAFSHRRD